MITDQQRDEIILAWLEAKEIELVNGAALATRERRHGHAETCKQQARVVRTWIGEIRQTAESLRRYENRDGRRKLDAWKAAVSGREG